MTEVRRLHWSVSVRFWSGTDRDDQEEAECSRPDPRSRLASGGADAACGDGELHRRGLHRGRRRGAPDLGGAFRFGDSFVSFLGAFSSNAIAAGLGALVGGRICDLFGRKKIYQWDLLLYAFGMLWIVFAAEPWMLLIGFFTVGVTVGADVPASWTLITETAPSEQRGRFAGLAQVLWYVGAIAPLLLGIALLDLGMLATRIIFAHLLVVALITWALRQRMTESVLWTDARGKKARRHRPRSATA